MSKVTVVHETILVERHYKAPASRVFAAWADPALRKQWDVPVENWEVVELDMDFRVGGHERSSFGAKGGDVYKSDGRYLDIVPDARIISSGTMLNGDIRTSTTLCTIQLIAAKGGTKLTLTDQSAYLDGRESPEDRKSGWTTILDRLGAYLQRG